MGLDQYLEVELYISTCTNKKLDLFFIRILRGYF